MTLLPVAPCSDSVGSKIEAMEGNILSLAPAWAVTLAAAGHGGGVSQQLPSFLEAGDLYRCSEASLPMECYIDRKNHGVVEK